MVRNCASGIGLPDRNIAITKGHCGRIGLHYKMVRVLGSIRLPLGSLGSGGMYLQTMEISTVLQLETAII